MKKFIGSLVVMLAMIMLVACGEDGDEASADAEQELADVVKVFTWAEYFDEDVIQGFTEKYGVEVVVDYFSSNQEMYTKLQSGAIDYDVAFPTDYFVKKMIEDDMLLEIDYDVVENIKYIDEALLDQDFDPGNVYSVPYAFGSTGIVYNEKYTGEVDSWEDLFNPEFKGKVIMNEDSRELFTMAFQMLGVDINDPSQEDIDAATELIAELHENVFAYDSTPMAQFISEEAWIGLGYSDGAVQVMVDNPNVRYTLPKEGGSLWMDNFVIPKTTKNKYTAEMFINYLLEPEVSMENSVSVGFGNPNKAAVELMDEEIRNNEAAYPPPEAIENAAWFEVLDSSILNQFNQAVNEIKTR